MEEAALRQDETTCEVAALERNSTVTGTLTTSDCPLDDGTFVDFWTFDGYSGETVTIDLQSDDFDTFLLPGETYLLEVTTSVPGYSFLSQINPGNDPLTHYPISGSAR
jgi:hypothetical protein